MYSAPCLAWRVPARGSVAGLAVKIPLRFAPRDFERVSRSFAVPPCLPHGVAISSPPPGLRCRVGRFAAERHRRSLTPSRAHTMEVYVTSLAREGDFIFIF